MPMPTNSPESPWGPPPTGIPGMPPPVMQQQPRNGLGTAALVVGIVGTLLGTLIFLFWLAGPLGILALIFGIVGLGRVRKGQANNKGIAIAGIALGGVATALAVVGLIVTVFLVKDAVKAVDDAKSVKGSPAATAPADSGASASEEPAEEPAEDKPLAFGQAMTYDDGIKVTVGKPATYKPDEFAAGHKAGNVAVQVKITIVNGTKKPYDITLALPSAKDAKGAEPEMVFDGHYSSKPFAGKLLPGKQAVSQFTFSLPADAAKELQVELSPDIEHDDAIWVGAVK
ncbi:DUF4190 domain-containing protein [Streptomyces sp. NBC_01465]|uniref:DUF4190 domain-containing protein n=1 Tax=Streptomyces sp. NBC_01465 TaxID=2903878 RepID=UPI002E37A225|nr:DUF4190 domain-containing protein [Streptomyces sp. NBC_01465]